MINDISFFLCFLFPGLWLGLGYMGGPLLNSFQSLKCYISINHDDISMPCVYEHFCSSSDRRKREKKWRIL